MHAAWVKDESGTRSLHLLATFDPVSALFTLNPSLLNEKLGTNVQTQTSKLSTATHDAPGYSDKSLDQAYWLVEETRNVADENATVDLENLRKKFDWQLMPMMFCCSTIQFIDKTTLNVSRLLGGIS